MFLTGPRVVQAAVGEDVTVEELGGTHVHQGNGVTNFVVDDDQEAGAVTRELLGYHVGGDHPPAEPLADPATLGDSVPGADRAGLRRGPGPARRRPFPRGGAAVGAAGFG